MNTVLHAIGTLTFREQRMLHIGNGPENVPPQERPQGDIHFDLRGDQTPPEVLEMMNHHIAQLQETTDLTAEDQMRRVEEQAQRYIDTCLAEGRGGRQKATEYVHELNRALHEMRPQKFHAGATNMRVKIKPYNPTQFPPEVIARKNRINELEGQINEVDRNIQMLMRDFRQNAVQYRGYKGASMDRRNITPEITKFLMQFPQASMQASAAPLNQLYAIKFQLQQELAGVKSGRIKVPVPTAGVMEDPSLIMPARFAANATGDTRFNLDGAPGGIGPDGLPLQNALPTAAEQAQILRYTARWRSAKTEEERETVEGFLMMEGVDVDGSTLENDEIVMVSPEERGMQFLIGLITVLKSFLDRLAKKKTDVADAEVSIKDPSEMTPDEQAAEKEGNDKKLTDFKDQKMKAASEIKDIDKKLKAVPPPEGEVKEKLETDLKNKKEEVKNIEEEIRKLEERNAVLADPTKSKENDQAITQQEPLQEGQTKPETLQEDPVFQEFARKKEVLRTDYHEFMSKARPTDNENYASYMDTQVQKDFAKTGRIYDWRKEEAKIWQEMIDTLDSFIDHMTLEKNAEGKYRITINFTEMKQSIMGKSYKITSDDAQKLMTKMNEGSEGKARLSIDGDKLATPFMSGDELMELKI